MVRDQLYDVVVVGAGTAGIPAALFAADRGLRVLLVEGTNRCGGNAGWARELSAAGLAQQQRIGIVDSPARHLEDLIRISRGKLNRRIAELAVQFAPDTLRWLQHSGLRFVDNAPQADTLHEPYSVPRTYWVEGGGAALSAFLEQELQRAVAAPGSTLHLAVGTRLGRLISANGTVTGVSLSSSGRPEAITETVVTAGNTILCCGGYIGNDLLFEQMHCVPRRLDWGPAWHDGTALVAGAEVDAGIHGADCLNITYGAVLESDQLPSPIAARLDTLATYREPWELTVNLHGERFVAEDTPSIDLLERALLRQPSMKAWWIFDAAVARKAPPRIRKWYSKWTVEAFNERPGFHSAPDIMKLAQCVGIDPRGLARTVGDYNLAQRTRADALGRHHMPLPIHQPPFFAIGMQGAAYLSAAGIDVDPQLRVLDSQGRIIPGLYAAGDAIGAWQTMGDSACSGMLATSALTFGRLVGTLVGSNERPTTNSPFSGAPSCTKNH